MILRSALVGILFAFALISCNNDSTIEGPAPNDTALTDSPVDGSATRGEQSPGIPAPPTVTAPAQLLKQEEIAGGWISLFDGQSLFGWQPNDDPENGGANWHVAEGVIAADESDKPSLLLTAVRFSDFELRFDYRLEKGGNSGVFLRSIPNPENPAVDCYELNMCNTHPEFPTGSIVGRKKVALDASGDDALPVEGEWHSVHVRVEGNQIVAKFDDRVVIDLVDDSEHQLPIGFIGLQHNQGKIEFRNVALRPVGTMPLFDGKTLIGWREVPGSQSEFTVGEDAIHIKNGPGFLETSKTWSDFVLQFDVRTNAKDVNSGLFFRAMTGTDDEPSNGYELQICNSFADGDRTKPNDYGRGFGTGAIMHRAPARYIVADDLDWATITLIADGPRYATWVNGFPTAQWADDRDPQENPRNGLRLQAGHLSLQAHDEKADVSFRQLRLLPVDLTAKPESSAADE